MCVRGIFLYLTFDLGNNLYDWAHFHSTSNLKTWKGFLRLLFQPRFIYIRYRGATGHYVEGEYFKEGRISPPSRPFLKVLECCCKRFFFSTTLFAIIPSICFFFSFPFSFKKMFNGLGSAPPPPPLPPLGYVPVTIYKTSSMQRFTQKSIVLSNTGWKTKHII